MRIVIAILILITGVPVKAQYKSYIIGVKGDTLNRVDANNLKQGRWVTRTESLRGEPGFEEEGAYIDGKKTGVWRRYSLMGDLLATENYKWGVKHGISQYYNLYGLEREESWRAFDPENPYDTIDVPDLHSDMVYKKVIRVETASVKYGTWRYYDPQRGFLVKTEEYMHDQLVDPNKKAGNKSTAQAKDSTSLGADTVAKSKVKPKEVLDYEKKNAKKKIKVRDGVTGLP